MPSFVDEKTNVFHCASYGRHHATFETDCVRNVYIMQDVVARGQHLRCPEPHMCVADYFDNNVVDASLTAALLLSAGAALAVFIGAVIPSLPCMCAIGGLAHKGPRCHA